jgi:hypothetical protein
MATSANSLTFHEQSLQFAEDTLFHVLAPPHAESRKGKPWNKVDKTIKRKCLKTFSKQWTTDQLHCPDKSDQLYQMLLKTMNEKRLHKAMKDIVFSKEEGEIVSIPGLTYDPAQDRFYLKTSI